MSRTGAQLTQGLLGSGSARGGSFVISRCQTRPNGVKRDQKLRPRSVSTVSCFLTGAKQAGSGLAIAASVSGNNKSGR